MSENDVGPRGKYFIEARTEDTTLEKTLKKGYILFCLIIQPTIG